MNVRELELSAARGRLLALEMVYRAASGHIGGSLSAMDALTELYFEELRVDTANPHDPNRDRFVMSKGHCTPALYAVLALRSALHGSMVIISHQERILEIADEIVVISGGSVLKHGTREEILPTLLREEKSALCPLGMDRKEG